MGTILVSSRHNIKVKSKSEKNNNYTQKESPKSGLLQPLLGLFICAQTKLFFVYYRRPSGREIFVKAKLFCPEIAGLFCRIAGLFCHDSRANLSLKPVCFGIAIS